MEKFIALTSFSFKGMNIPVGTILESPMNVVMNPSDINVLIRLGRISPVESGSHNLESETALVGTRSSIAMNENFVYTDAPVEIPTGKTLTEHKIEDTKENKKKTEHVLTIKPKAKDPEELTEEISNDESVSDSVEEETEELNENSENSDNENSEEKEEKNTGKRKRKKRE